MTPDAHDISVQWAREASAILNNPTQTLELVRRRLELLVLPLREPFSQEINTTKIAIVGYPNRGKTTFAYSVVQTLVRHEFPTSYIDLDIYTHSGEAISGKVDWSKRPKNDFMGEPDKEKVALKQALDLYRNSAPGIVIGDCPGKIENYANKLFISESDLVVILCSGIGEISDWAKLCSKCGTGYLWLVSKQQKDLTTPHHPQISNLNRNVKRDIEILINTTDIVIESARNRDLTIPGYQLNFTNPELVALEEYLDFLFSMRLVDH